MSEQRCLQENGTQKPGVRIQNSGALPRWEGRGSALEPALARSLAGSLRIPSIVIALALVVVLDSRFLTPEF
jgi:hypothetical protein